MKHVSEYRDPAALRGIIDEILRTAKRSWTLMEICGGQTHSIIRNGLDGLLQSRIRLVHGPGCPVCVTPLELIDQAHELARQPGVIFTSFGDMLRVPGSFRMKNGEEIGDDLLSIRSGGADVRVVTSPLQAVDIARQHPDRMVVFFSIGFETTAPATAMAVHTASKRDLTNFCMLVSHVTVPPAVTAVMESTDVQIDGFLAAGHVCTVMGIEEYHALTAKYRVPIVVTGFEPVDITFGILKAVRQLERGESRVENAYTRTAKDEGNRHAREMMAKVFERCDRAWRGLGLIPMSGFRLRPKYRAFDALERFPCIRMIGAGESTECRIGDVLRGVLRPDQCPAFGIRCTPLAPLGATMVSDEGACAAYYRYRHVGKGERHAV